MVFNRYNTKSSFWTDYLMNSGTKVLLFVYYTENLCAGAIFYENQ